MTCRDRRVQNLVLDQVFLVTSGVRVDLCRRGANFDFFLQFVLVIQRESSFVWTGLKLKNVIIDTKETRLGNRERNLSLADRGELELSSRVRVGSEQGIGSPVRGDFGARDRKAKSSSAT